MLNSYKKAGSVGIPSLRPIRGYDMQTFARLRAKFGLGSIAALAMLTALLCVNGCQKKDEPKSQALSEPAIFETPDAAANAIYEAAKSGDLKSVYAIFGEQSGDYLITGDAAAATASLRTFVQDYQQMHRWAKVAHGGLTLDIGVENYSFPIPLRKNSAGQWSFDTGAGKKEILARRIGDNELSTLRVLENMADAQAEYFSQTHDGSKVHQYSQKFYSEPGKHDGLYWKSGENEPESPLGPLAAQAAAEGHQGEANPATPFHGYFYRILVKQGAHAKGGAKEYVANGSMTGGFAFLAYPADYRKSGVMSFLINKDGAIYQCDLGDNTSELAKQIDSYDPDETWQPVQ
jgi:hypothetical protein